MTDSRDRGIHATNQDFIGYEQIRKTQQYRLAEEAGAERFDEEYRIQSCSMAGVRTNDAGAVERFANELGTALEDIGFAVLTDHGVDTDLYRQAERQVVEVFAGHTAEEKLRFAAHRHGSVNQGYFPIKETSDIHPDLVEGWVFCRRAFDFGERPDYRVEEFWPNPDHERFFRRLCIEHEQLILPIMQSILTYLGCDPNLYDERLTRTNIGLRLNYYPGISSEDDCTGAGRLLGHEDVTMFTIVPAPSVEGLQVLNRRNMSWIRLQAPPGTIILNTGDYMQRITNNRLPSTTHRVSKPRDPALRRRTRVSFPMNVYLWEDEMLEVLPGLGPANYEPVRAEDFHTRITSKYYGDDYAGEGSAGDLSNDL